MKKMKVLFLCTGNSCRSQMAEGWARALKSDVIEAWSAGVETHGMNPHAVRVMKEAGVDIGGHFSKLANDLRHVQFDFVVTVCDNARESCPVFTGETVIFARGFDDPPALAQNTASPEEVLGVICHFILTTFSKFKHPAILQISPRGSASRHQ